MALVNNSNVFSQLGFGAVALRAMVALVAPGFLLDAFMYTNFRINVQPLLAYPMVEMLAFLMPRLRLDLWRSVFTLTAGKYIQWMIIFQVPCNVALKT